LPPEVGSVPAFPPKKPYYMPPIGTWGQPPNLVIPPIPGGVTPPPPPCVDNPDTPGDDCNPTEPPVEPPPTDTPEPGTLLILLVGAAAIFLTAPKRRKATVKLRRK
jgi:hypothetical protein